MSQDIGCSFCEHLPETPACGWGGRASKCPVCKQELWTDQSGGTHRIVAGAAAPRRVWPMGVGCSAAAAVCAIVTVAIWINTRPTPNASAHRLAQATPTHVLIADERVEAPPVVAQAKQAVGHIAARAKPNAPPPAPPVEVAVVVKTTQAPTRVKPDQPAVPSMPAYSFLSNVGDLEAQLRAVPEVNFDPQYGKKTKKELADIAKDIAKTNKENAQKDDKKNAAVAQDAFIRQLMKDRPDLAGMPFLLGKDCSITKDEAKALATGSLTIREAFATASRSQSKGGSMGTGVDGFAYSVFSRLSNRGDFLWKQPTMYPAIQQIMLGEHRDFRHLLVEHVKAAKESKAGALLANRAVFDTDPMVRGLAVEALRGRPLEEYRAVLVKSLRYPWMPVVRNAAHALAALSVKEAIPDLVGCLEEAPPDAPFTVPGEDGKRKVMVRELVRVNHHRNCLLCHAPLADDLDVRRSPEFPIGPVPSAQEPLPPSLSPVYYSQRSGVTLVRADITYLRQDFSLQQEVAEPGKWSSVQRFDFLVRTRELTPKEIEERTPVIVLEYRDTIAEALRHLSGKDLPPIAASWRAALDMPAAKMSAK